MNTMEKLILHIMIKAAAILGRLYPLGMRGVGGGKDCGEDQENI